MADVLLTAVLCLFADLPDAPPGITLQGSYFSLYDIDRTLCPNVTDSEVTFNLYTRNLTDPRQIKIGNDTTLENSEIDLTKLTVIFFHGFLESYTAIVSQKIKEAYLKNSDCNVILVDAKILYAGPDYLTAANNVEAVGKYSALFVDYLVSKGLALQNLIVSGMSLGGQTTGLLGQNVQSGNISRIVAYDPAGPLFDLYPPEKRLDPTDADFVTVIHSNPSLNGYYTSCGDVDFWINGYVLVQPGCSLIETSLESPGNIPELAFCSHYLSYRVGAYSLVQPNAFPSTKCSTWLQYTLGACSSNDVQYLGSFVDSTVRGNYWLKVNTTFYTLYDQAL